MEMGLGTFAETPQLFLVPTRLLLPRVDFAVLQVSFQLENNPL